MEEVKEILNKCRKIKLFYNNKRYKARTIKHVIHIKREKAPCTHCGYGTSHTYMVSTDDICFCIDYWDGCLTYSDQVEVIPYQTGSEKELELYNQYFKNDKKELLDDHSSTDSY